MLFLCGRCLTYDVFWNCKWVTMICIKTDLFRNIFWNRSMLITILIFLPFYPLCLFTFYLFDKAVKFQFSQYKEHWEADSGPLGFFWVPEESENKFSGYSHTLSSIVRERQASKWIFITPNWAKSDREASRLIWHYRICAVLSFSAFIAWGTIVLFSDSIFH